METHCTRYSRRRDVQFGMRIATIRRQSRNRLQQPRPLCRVFFCYTQNSTKDKSGDKECLRSHAGSVSLNAGHVSMKIIQINAIKALVALLLLIGSSAHCGEFYTPQWEPTPGVMLYWLVVESDGEIIGTDSLSWPDGRSALFQYVKTKDGLYRCVDYHDEAFRETGNMCYKSKKWPP